MTRRPPLVAAAAGLILTLTAAVPAPLTPRTLRTTGQRSARCRRPEP